MPSVLADARFHDEAAAFAFVESRVWPDGPVCPHCRETKRIHKIKPNPARKVRLGLYACGACRKQFTVKVGTVFESSHVPLHVWLQAMHLLCSSKKGISSNQLHRLLGVTLKTAWFISHRIREAMKTGALDPLGGNGGVVEADETYYGEKADPAERRIGRISAICRGHHEEHDRSPRWSRDSSQDHRTAGSNPVRPIERTHGLNGSTHAVGAFTRP